MNDSILMAIESLCDDIATNPEAEDNRKRAEAVACLAFSDIFVPDTEDEPTEGEDTVEAAPTTAPEPGKHFEYHGIKFVVLGMEQGGVLCVPEELLPEEHAFDEDNCNDWRKSSLRKYLNEEYIKNFDKADLLPFISDLTTDSGQKDYGASEDYIALLSCDLYRKYREFVPKYNNWWWTITPWHIYPSYANIQRIVYVDGSVSINLASCSYGVAPACLFNPSIFNNPRR